MSIITNKKINNRCKYETIIIGGGHAGIEAALASARLGVKSLMICGNLDRIGNMPCNPSIGGPAKGILVREIDALGGEMAKAADQTALQFKMLNLSKGPAVWALRVQSDKDAYSKYMKNKVTNQEKLDVLEALVSNIMVSENKVKGVILESGQEIYASKIIVTTGTYLSSRILVGNDSFPSGPDGEATNYDLSKSLKDLGFNLIRLKTGTPPRVLTKSIDFSKSRLELGTNLPLCFSYEHHPKDMLGFDKQLPCYLIWTTEHTHQIIKDHLNESSMYAGIVEGVGPRYCPSIEDKLVRFNDKEKHQIFLEPESADLSQIYIQGFSTSMPHYVQDKMVKSLPGFSNAIISKYAYAIEYDAINPLELKSTLESKFINGLYFGGQVNGTSGYEEAAAQGLIAGINSAMSLFNKEEVVLRRDEAYIGVLIDDLVTKGINDPYRMLTSRAEYRLLLRHDNADQRLTEYGYQVGLITEERYHQFTNKIAKLKLEKSRLESIRITPKAEINNFLLSINSPPIVNSISASELMKRPEISYQDIVNMLQLDNYLSEELGNQIDIEVKYEGYISKARKQAAKMLQLETRKIPQSIDYNSIKNLASEAREKLNRIRPLTVSQAMRISGVNPSDIAILLVYLESKRL